jgi:hypothetical protein
LIFGKSTASARVHPSARLFYAVRQRSTSVAMKKFNASLLTVLLIPLLTSCDSLRDAFQSGAWTVTLLVLTGLGVIFLLAYRLWKRK